MDENSRENIRRRPPDSRCRQFVISRLRVWRLLSSGRHPEAWSAIDKCKSPRRVGGVKGGAAAERSEGTLDAAEHRAIMRGGGGAHDWQRVTNGTRSIALCLVILLFTRKGQAGGSGGQRKLTVDSLTSVRSLSGI